jgi:hypothetical protein
MMMVSEKQREQRERALQLANHVRQARAEIKRQLNASELTFEQLLEDPPPEVLTASVGEVLLWLPGIGPWRSQRILAKGPGNPGVGRTVEIGHLSRVSKGRLVERYYEIRPNSYTHLAA